jgi:hypothetical protein
MPRKEGTRQRGREVTATSQRLLFKKVQVQAETLIEMGRPWVSVSQPCSALKQQRCHQVGVHCCFQPVITFLHNYYKLV